MKNQNNIIHIIGLKMKRDRKMLRKHKQLKRFRNSDELLKIRGMFDKSCHKFAMEIMQTIYKEWKTNTLTNSLTTQP